VGETWVRFLSNCPPGRSAVSAQHTSCEVGEAADRLRKGEALRTTDDLRFTRWSEHAGLHSGRGLVSHYHADGFSATQSGFNLYNAIDYVSHTHPPIVSLGFDGVAGFGRYLEGTPPATVSTSRWTTGVAIHTAPMDITTTPS